jgi:hypothetical protein
VPTVEVDQPSVSEYGIEIQAFQQIGTSAGNEPSVNNWSSLLQSLR